MVVSSLGKVYLVVLIVCCHLALLSCRSTDGATCPSVPKGFVDPLTYIGAFGSVRNAATSMLAWSNQLLLEFLALSGVLFTISENMVAVYYAVMAPYWIAKDLLSKTFSAVIFGAVIAFLVFSAMGELP